MLSRLLHEILVQLDAWQRLSAWDVIQVEPFQQSSEQAYLRT